MIHLSGISVVHGDRVLFSKADLLVRRGDRIGLVGPNGAGKSTVFRLITGQEKPDSGSITMDPGVDLGYFSQETGEMQGGSLFETLIRGAGRVSQVARELTDLENRMADPEGFSEKDMDRYGELQEEFLNLDGYNLETKAETILTGLGFSRNRWDEPVESFSGGWKMRIALGQILLQNPTVLLMDEPTNHLDLESIVWLESWLNTFDGTIVMTSHDREFMTRLCSRTVEIAQGTITTYSGDYDFYLTERQIRREQLEATFKRQQAMLAKEEEFIARFAARASHAAQVQSRIKTIEKIDRVELPPDPKTMKIRFAPVQRSGDQVVVLENLEKSWPQEDGSRLQVFGGISATIARGDKIALTGINGAGKSTLLKVISGQTEPSSGVVTLGGSVEMGYFSQYSSDLLEPGNTILEEVQHRLPLATIGSIKSILGAFQFSGDDSEKKISVLSGGEKSRVMLACMLARPVNFLVLDEPTNHLDIESREVLLEALQEFDGTLILVSHDRYFLTRIANRVFEIDRGTMSVFEGDYPYYQEKTAALSR
ncbi:ABC-F family ATP-binding cassette domain-containing protein [Spirochaeta lutea]|uniref:Glycosyl transferase family 1 n=1 Tax=Spirochaeta lutea TaxID=1480694 RepID=A0A098QWF2_9SPIO|nr:ABC-F family ATP-binding cassette domain-containing protein [Spirochaeta lutea]KGE72049.1 glycosyl transferase family 1 [Spirochaeta lutea]